MTTYSSLTHSRNVTTSSLTATSHNQVNDTNAQVTHTHTRYQYIYYIQVILRNRHMNKKQKKISYEYIVTYIYQKETKHNTTYHSIPQEYIYI